MLHSAINIALPDPTPPPPTLGSNQPTTAMATNNNNGILSTSAPPGARRLNAQELERVQAEAGLSAMLESFGHTTDSLRINPETGALFYPADVTLALDAYKEGRMTAFSELSCDLVGMVVIMRDLSESGLNGKYHRVVKVFPEEDKMLIDVTPSDWPPARVRYVKVSSTKVASMHYPQSHDGLNFRTCLAAVNRDRAFALAGYDPLNIECLAVRPHPDIRLGRLWQDLPLLCAKLNRERAPGYPFEIEFGFQIFGKAEYQSIAEMCTANMGAYKFETCYSGEAYIVIRDFRGNRIDPTPDFESDPTQRACPKLFLPDPAFNMQSWNNMFDAISNYVQEGWMPTAPHLEELMAGWNYESSTFTPGDGAVALGMIRGDLNQSWPDPNAKSIMCHPFVDSGLSLPHPERTELHAEMVEMRRMSVIAGAVLLSRKLAAAIAENHKYDHITYDQLIRRDEPGTICFACYTRLTVAETKLCGGCGKARYCSNACQLWHWKDHKACCSSKEERARRRESAARARHERQEQLRRHDEHEALLKAERSAKEAQRKALAARTRAERVLQRANDIAERVRRAVAQAPKPPRGKSKSKKAPTMEQKLKHTAWDSDDERAARTAAFMANQEAEKLEAVARKAQEKAKALKKLAVDASAAREAATHCVPCAPSIASVIEHDLSLYD